MTQQAKSDRELLEAAAKAAGINLHVWGTPGAENFADMDALAYGRLWNPLTNDGDALRLVVKLRLDISQMEMEGKQVLRVLGPASVDRTYEVTEDDPYAATRRVIVRAAAAISRAGEA